MQVPAKVRIPNYGMGFLVVEVQDVIDLDTEDGQVVFCCTWADDDSDGPFLLLHEGDSWQVSGGMIVDVELQP
jgi:hypothetical protein